MDVQFASTPPYWRGSIRHVNLSQELWFLEKKCTHKNTNPIDQLGPFVLNRKEKGSLVSGGSAAFLSLFKLFSWRNSHS